MFKKILSALICSVICCCLIGFAACGATHEHNYTERVVEPTCTEKGYTLHTCSCGEFYKDNETDALGHNYVDGVCSRCQGIDPAYHAPTDFDTWLDSDDAEDFDGDRNITEADFEIYKAYIVWKASTNARDYDGDGNINYADYELSISGEDWVTWLNSAEAYDYNKDGRTDRNDYAIYLERKAVVGKYVIEDFDYEINSTEYTIQLLGSSYVQHR